jgi:hypothetical protein
MYILVTLNPDQGTDLGPNFTLTANVGTLVPATATLTELLAGVSVIADNAVTQVIITSQGICTNSLTLSVLPVTTTSTTTTTTTLAPTTTTTTFSPEPCNCVEVNITSVGGVVATLNCFGVNQNYAYSTAGIRYICASVVGGLLQADIISGTGTLTPVGNCKTGPCPPLPPTTTTTRASTTTTTSGPTTTTTAGPTTTTTTAAATTTTTLQPSLYRYSSASSTDACNSGLTMTNVVLTNPPFCSATTIQCDEFVLEIAGLPVYIRSGNSYRTATINDPNTSGIATFDAGTCIVCTTTTTTTSTTTTTTTAAPVVRTVTGVGAGSSDILGEIYITASVSLSGNVSADTVIEVRVSTVPYNNVVVPVTILNGSSSGSGETYVGQGSLPSSISGECVLSSDNIYVTFTGYQCV